MSRCDECGGKCCKLTPVHIHAEQSAAFVEWATATRGGAFVPVAPGVIEWRIPHPCRHLTGDGLCAIYEDRPNVCREFAVDGPECRRVIELAKEGK